MDADDAKPGRIRWHERPGTGTLAFTGHAGAISHTLFSVLKPWPSMGETKHTLTTNLPDMGAKRAHGTPDEVKAEAERWLEEFASSLGAVFPTAGREWGTRFTVGEPRDHECESEEAARRSVTALLEHYPYWNPVLVSRVPAIPAGPWEAADGG